MNKICELLNVIVFSGRFGEGDFLINLGELKVLIRTAEEGCGVR